MWLSKRAAQGAGRIQGGASVGDVTIGGAAPGVWTNGERRSVGLAGPGGYCWRPRVGESVLVLTSADGEAFAAGAVETQAPAELESGEVCIQSQGGAQIWLKNDGTILLVGKLAVESL